MRGGVRSRQAWGAALVVALAATLWAGIRSARRVEPPLRPPAQRQEAAVAPPEGQRGLLGVVVGEGVEVRAPLDGRLEQLSVRLGDEVAAGAELGRLDARPLRQEATMAEARLAAAESEVARLELELGEASERLARYARVPTETFSADELAAARYQEKSAGVRLAAARATVRERQAALAQARQRLEETTLRAPFAGRVVERLVDPGGVVQSGSVLMRLLRAGPVRVRFAIPEERLGEVRVGAPVRLELPVLGRSVSGRVERVAPEVDAASRMVFALAVFTVPTETEGLVVGTVARVWPQGVLTSGARPATEPGG